MYCVTIFQRYNLQLPKIHKGWFSDTLPNGLPEKICFAYLDGDLYESILVSLEHVYPKLTKGAICLIDDYNDPSVDPLGWNSLPGVKKACDEYLADKPEKVTLTIDRTALGLDAAELSLYAPAVQDFQPEGRFGMRDEITIDAKRGLLLILKNSQERSH